MTGERSRYGLLVSALGALVLAASVFLMWYSPRADARVAAGHPVGALTGIGSLGGLGFVLLAIALLALLDAGVPLARHAAGALPAGAGGAVVLLGAAASALIAFRMLQPPSAVAASLSLREGPWIALLGALTISAGGVWPRALPGLDPAEPLGPGIFSALTGWTPGT